jgi:hypothetical protein
MLSREQAAAYCGVSVPTFMSQCPVIPVKMRTRVLYDRTQLDRWLDTLNPYQPELRRGKQWLELLDREDDRQRN